MGLRTTLDFARGSSHSQLRSGGEAECQKYCMLWFLLVFRWVDPLSEDSYSHRPRPVPSAHLGASDLLWSLTALLQSNFSLRAMRLHQAKRREAVLAVQLDVQFARPGVNSVLSYKPLCRVGRPN